MSESLAFIGLGAMGAPMARRLTANHTPPAVYDPVPERANALASVGCRIAASPREAAIGADIVMLMVVDGKQVREALLGDAGVVHGLRPGGTVIVLSTIGPACLRDIERELLAHPVNLLDAPVSGGASRAETGDLLVMVAGDDAVVAAARGVLETLSASIAVCGSAVGDAQAVKLVNQLLCGIHIVAAAEALAYAEALGIDPTFALNVVEQGAAGSFMLSDRGRRMVSDAFSPASSALSIFLKDMGLVSDAAHERNCPIPLASLSSQIFAMGAALGSPTEDDSAVVRVFRPAGRSRGG